MDLRKLKAFVIVAEELSFRKSAEILGMSQPPLTRLIASLEQELSTQLFERTTRHVSLTGAGVVLLKEAREILAALERIDRDVRLVGKIKQGALRVGFSATAFLARFPVIMDEFRAKFPHIIIDLQQRSPSEVLDLVRRGKLDFGFVEGSISDPSLQSHVVHDEKMGVLLPRKHPLAKRKEIIFSELKNETIILHSRNEAKDFYDCISHLIKGLKQKPKIYVKDEHESCPILVATGKGVSLTITGAKNFVPDETSFVPIKNMFLPVVIYWREQAFEPALQTFLSFVIENRFVKPPESRCLVLENVE